MRIKKKNNFSQLIDDLLQTHSILQSNAQKAVNFNLVLRNWLIGYYIIEYEQNGEDRAKYGEKLIDEIAKILKSHGLKGLAATPLRICRSFYRTYPQIQPILSVELQSAVFEPIRDSIANKHSIQPTLSVELEKDLTIAPELLISRLSFSHFIELVRVDDPLERLFYEVESIKNNWGIRELKRAISTSLFFRTGLSTNKKAVIAKIKSLKPESNIDVIRNPYFLEFLGLEEKSEYSESELEQAILTHLQKFLIELGTGFCFEARQKRITFDNLHYRIDLVFYHRILKCHVLIDLKVGEFSHVDAGQMNLYLNYYKDNEMVEGDNPPIGIILCGDKSDTLVKYATAGIDDQLFVSKYLVKLPEKKVLEDFIKREMV